MSILLEALKKSEAQRQLGRTPTLDSPSGGEIPAGKNQGIWVPVVMSLLTVGIISWIGLEQFERPETVAGSPGLVPAVSMEETAAETLAPEGSERSARSAKTPVMDFTAPGRTPSPDTAAAVSSGADSRVSASVAKPLASKGRPPAAAPSAEESLAVATQDVLMPAKTEESGTESHRNRTDRIQPSVPDSISYWQMPQSVRGGLPELHISVLVYAENPGDRFLLINGQRLHEKEEFESGMVLDEIQRDRAIFNYGDYRFYLKN